jgi:DNA end-binding protein Ku
MRAIWKGHISFGLVNVPVSLYPAEQRTDLQFHMVDSRDFARVRYERVNAETGAEVPWDQIVKGYEYDDGNYVVFGKDELEKVAPEATKAVEIEAFVDLDGIDPLFFDKPYYLKPGKKGEKGYVLLRDAMRESGKAGIARVVIRTREYLAAMTPRGDAIVLNLLRYQQEIRPLSELEIPGSAEQAGVTKQEAKMAKTLIDSMAAEWNPADYHDEYREAMLKWIEKKIETGEIKQGPEASDAAHDDIPGPINMMEALRKSLETTKKPAPKRKKSSKKAASRKKAG